VGGARTALFNWLLARKSGGRFVLRIEDTDQARHVADSLDKILDDLRWLGLDWDEGPEVGGERGPYFQSERLEIYNQYFDQLLVKGQAYCAFDTQEELAAAREQAKREKRDFRYKRPDPLPTVADAEKAQADGRPVVIRFKMPEREITVNDRILGPVTLARSEADDFIIRKADGWPTYHFAVVVDDELMGITDILRGQEHLINTPKHVMLQEALDFRTPTYGHLPIILNTDGSKMSKRDKEKALANGRVPPEIDVHDFRLSGYLPETLVNYIALLGWNPGDDREKFTIEELIEAFSPERIGKASARFDREKLLAFSTDAMASADEDRLLAGFRDYVKVTESAMDRLDDGTLRKLLAVNKGFRTFGDIERKSGFIYRPDEAITFDPKAVKKVLNKNDGEGYDMLESLAGKLEAVEDWSAGNLEEFVKATADTFGVKMGKVAQPIRVAVSGTSISPSIGDTLELLGKEVALRRIRATIQRREELTKG
jgi:glutamyl-tRNA synthetase